MFYYKASLQLLGPVATRLLSGTIFGHLCWAWRDLKGEASLVEWLDGFRGGGTAFLVSDALPAGFLPRPLLRPWRPARRETTPTPESVQENDRAKRRLRAPFIPLEGFLQHRGQLSEALLQAGLGDEAPQLTEHRLAHNTIHRLTGTTPEAGGLYFMDELWPDAGKSDSWEVYAGTDIGRELLEDLFRHVGEHGYGRDATLGRGRFRVSVTEADAGIFEGEGNRRMSLSHGALTANMGDARYKLHTHYGKLGALFAAGESPFKYPLTLARPGATFAPRDDGPFGELLGDVHKDRPEIVHNAWHLAVPYTEVEE